MESAIRTSIQPEISVHPTPQRLTEVIRGRLERRRLAELLAAIHEHERRLSPLGRRSHDEALYSRTREIVNGSGERSR